MVVAGALCGMSRLSCKSEVTCECRVSCELRWIHLFVISDKNIEGTSRIDRKFVNLLRPATLRIDMHIALMLHVAGLRRSMHLQSVRDTPPIFLLGLKVKCIQRTSHATQHPQLTSLLHESGDMPHRARAAAWPSVAGALCGMSPLSCKTEATGECRVSCELQ